jgi:hypothetical protein
MESDLTIGNKSGKIFLKFSVADSGCLNRIQGQKDSGSQIRIKEFKYFLFKKLFLSSWKYEPGGSSQTPDPDLDFFPISDPESRDQKGHGPRIRDRNTAEILKLIFLIVFLFFQEGCGER